MPITLNDQNFEIEIENAKKPVLVDFWMFGCAPCFLLSPILEKLANDYGEKVIFAKANLDTVPLAAQKYGINMTPTVILFKEGRPVSGFIGARPENEIKEWLEENLKNNSENIEKLIKEYEKYAKENGWRLNPDKKIVERIVKGLLANEKKYGFRYCPCRRVTGNPEDDKPKICPCQFMQKEIEEQGHCLCGLFWK